MSSDLTMKPILENPDQVILGQTESSGKRRMERVPPVLIFEEPSQMAADVSYQEASVSLNAAEGHVKKALVMLLTSVSNKEPKERLTDKGGFVRPAIEQGSDSE
jgi:hypothetical protein